MLIIIIAIVIETVVMAYCLITKSRLEKTRSIIRIAEWVIFSSLGLVSVIHWSFRWYGLAALLFIWTTLGMRTLFTRKSVTKEYKARHVVSRTIAALVLVFLAVLPALVFPPYEPFTPSGAYAVGTARFTYTDETRIEQFTYGGENRRVNVTFWYPQNTAESETYPLIVFSHGGLGTENSNESLFLELASHGYIVCSIGHPYHALYTKGEDGHVTFVSMDYFRELQREDAQHEKPQSYKYYQKWMETRMGDINFVLDTILEKAFEGSAGVYSLVNVERIGVMGHSLGGSAALGIPRQRNGIDAVIALESPFLYDIMGVKNDAFVWRDESYPVPVLNIYSDSSWGHLSEWAQYAWNAALLSDSPADAFSQYLPGAGHFSLTDLSLASPFLVRLLEGGETTTDREAYLKNLNKICLGFFDRYLKNAMEIN